jgi:RNA polymerase sigma-70 factor (ECF subfamily)
MERGEGITQLLAKWSNGDKGALDELMPLVYKELRRLARGYLRRQRHDHTLQPTALVNEAYLKLIGQERVSLQNRAQFFGLAAKAMRGILVDYARRRNSDKRGGPEYTLPLGIADRLHKKPDVDLIALDDALNDLAELDQKHSRVVELRFFGGLTIEESAMVLGVSHATVERDWNLARAWLRRELAR